MHIKNLGVDAVDITRFSQWHLYKKNILLRMFTQQELDYVLACPQKSAERFATRFAVKEAVYKSISSLISDSFFAAARHIEVIKMETGQIACQVGWDKLRGNNARMLRDVRHEILISVTHTDTTAIAVVMIQ